MSAQKLAKQAKRLNIIDMAVGFTAMTRLLRSGSAELIKKHLGELLGDLDRITSEGDLKNMHEDFCQWFLKNITLAKKSEPPSYGQAAKILDIVLKVYVYYCRLPNPTKAEMLTPMLNSGIDSPILRHLLENFGYSRPIFRLKDINKKDYDLLQKMVRSDIKESFTDSIFAVQYDDIMWRRLNR